MFGGMRFFVAVSFLVITLSSSGQAVSKSDSLEVLKKCTSLFTAVQDKDVAMLDSMSADSIYCIICYSETDFSATPYTMAKSKFLNVYLNKIIDDTSFKRATTSNECKLMYQYSDKSLVIIFWTVYQPNELAEGHQGAQFGIHFKREEGAFKFAGMETIP